ncbi:MAG: mitomycin resistance protein [Patescibacteria group bacterium]|nr:mitomycin resistance protein [Patescibacteria group bacterium]
MQKNFELLGIKKPIDLAKKDAFKMYKDICKKTGTRHDPCVLDTYMAAVDFMNGGKPKPWWNFTDTRKKKYPNL